MRVLHLTTHINTGGITTYISNAVPALKQIGVETLVLSGGGSCKDDFASRGAKTFELNIKTKNELNPKLFFALSPLEKIVRENAIDVIHAHSRVTQVLAGILSKRTGIPVVTTCHGYFKRRLGRRIFPAWGDLTIAISQGVAEHLYRDFKLPEDKVLTVNNAVDIDELDHAYVSHDPEETKKSYGFQAADCVVGVVARLVADKGHEYLFRAVPLLVQEFPGIKLLIVGDGRERKKLERFSIELGIKDRVFFTGNVQDISKPLAAIDIFTLPATWREGFGLSVIEAMTCRKPVVVSNIWALNSLVNHRVTGILVEPKQSQLLADAIKFLIKNPAEAKKITSAARKKVEENFTISRMAQELKTIYERAVRLHPEYRQSS